MPGGRGKKGGYQPPDQPAAVSGPGALSARTDSPATQPIRVASGQPFGDRKALVEQQQAAPLATGGSPPEPPVAPPEPGSLTALHAPTQRAGEPVTAGLPIGAGAGPEALGMPAVSLADVLGQAALASGSTAMQLLAQRAQAMGQ